MGTTSLAMLLISVGPFCPCLKSGICPNGEHQPKNAHIEFNELMLNFISLPGKLEAEIKSFVPLSLFFILRTNLPAHSKETSLVSSGSLTLDFTCAS